MSFLGSTYHAVNALHGALSTFSEQSPKRLKATVRSIGERYNTETWTVHDEARKLYVALFSGFAHDGVPLFKSVKPRTAHQIIGTVEQLAELLEFEKEEALVRAAISQDQTQRSDDSWWTNLEDDAEREDLRQRLAYGAIVWQHSIKKAYRSTDTLQAIVDHTAGPLPVLEPPALNDEETREI